MLIETIIATILSLCVTCFATVNLYNILVLHKHSTGSEPHAEVERPSGFIVTIAALGTLVYFLEAFLYIILAFTSFPTSTTTFPLSYEFPFMPYTQAVGSALTTLGYITFIWSVLARGKYATSWEMRNTHKLVTWGPYHHVRHPSYSAYFLMFIGLALQWPSLFTLIPLAGILGYVKVTYQEEKLLQQHFGNEYAEYQKKTGKFIPKLRQRD